MPGREEIWSSLCNELGLKLQLYDLKFIRLPKLKDRRLYLKKICENNTSLLIIPVSIPINEEYFGNQDISIASFASISTGTDHIDFDFLKKEKIPFFNAPGFNTSSVVEYILVALKRTL